jgi:uncharacterized membrane protein (UPF0182 family)
VTDPVFGRDVGYYVCTVPVLGDAIGLGLALTILSLLATVLLYVLRRDIVVFRRQVTVEPSAHLHLAVLIAALFFLIALRAYFVRLPGLLYSTTGPLVGASYADLHAQLTGLRLAAIAAVAGGALVLAGARSHRLARNTLLAVAIYAGVSLVGVVVYPALIQKLVVAPNELSKEAPQLAFHIAATRRAWGLDSVVTRDLTGEAQLTEKDIRANGPPSTTSACGTGPLAPDVRPAPGDPHLLRLRLGGRRPLLDRRAVPPGAALAARAELGVAPHAHLHQ